jgi:hypothetical protein
MRAKSMNVIKAPMIVTLALNRRPKENFLGMNAPDSGGTLVVLPQSWSPYASVSMDLNLHA